jgi:hypothetical protein
MGIRAITEHIHANVEWDGSNVACFSDWIEALEYMNTLDVETVIPGHGETCGADGIARFLDYMNRLWKVTGESMQAGSSCDDTVRRVADQMFGHFETDPARLDAARMMFDQGTERLYQEIQLSRGRE